MEKPMLPVLGRPLIDYVLEAVEGSRSVSEVYVSVSGNVPLTREHLRQRGVKVIETSGTDYTGDLDHALQVLRTDHVLICPADLPLITAEDIGRVIGRYSRSGVESYSVAVPYDLFRAVGERPTYRFVVDGVDAVLCGVSVVDRKKMAAGVVLTEGYLVMRSEDLALNAPFGSKDGRPVHSSRIERPSSRSAGNVSMRSNKATSSNCSLTTPSVPPGDAGPL